MAWFLTYPSSYNPIDRIPIITRLETYYLVKNNWQGVEVLPNDENMSDFHNIWKRAILTDAQNVIVLDHGSSQTSLMGTKYIKKTSDTSIPILVHEKITAYLLFDESIIPTISQG